MDLTQSKLSRSEWNAVEIPVSDEEKNVIEMIMEGFSNPAVCNNTTHTLASLMKIEISETFEHYLFTEYFQDIVRALCSVKGSRLNKWYSKISDMKHKKPTKADIIRMENVRSAIRTRRGEVFEYVLLDFCMGLLGKPITTPNVAYTKKPVAYYLYSLIQFTRISVFAKTNRYVREFTECAISEIYDAANPETNTFIRTIFTNALNFIEKNPLLIQFEDRTLYSHQKTLFRAIDSKPHIAKLILYMAPTGTGKTLSPLGLSQKYRVIFVCVARHVGLALAKSAISVGKRVAFAFGCETASDIRLHYFAAKEYKVNKRSGGIGKVDNSIGTKVEIMICDVASYITAMHYMLAFNDVSNIITFWDEPTITMDKPEDPIHALIHRNWCENRIPKMILSCATLPKLNDISQTINDFKCRFVATDEDTGEEYEPEIITIDSYECKKSITLLTKDSKCSLPHLLFSNYRDIVKCVEHCKSNKTLLRYFNVNEIVRFVLYLDSIHALTTSPEMYFKEIANITMNSLKQYYLRVLEELRPDSWTAIHNEMKRTLPYYFTTPIVNLSSNSGNMRKTNSVDSASSTQQTTTTSGGGVPIRRAVSVANEPPVQEDRIFIITRDAHTLTDGPTIFLAEDVDKIGMFYIKSANIPEYTLNALLTTIEQNNSIQRRIEILEKEISDKTGETTDTKMHKEQRRKIEREPNKETQRLLDQVNTLREQIQVATMNPVYVPNTRPHQQVWLPASHSLIPNAFMPIIDDVDVRDIMNTNVDTERKLLLLLGIGVFSHTNDTQYAEIMKRMAYEQRLFLIIASSDYIYGTNYQFCHGFIGKDLTNMTQQKTIQAIGRIGRNNIQNEYSVRFRDDSIILQLFQKIEHNVEAHVMSRLFCSARDDEEDDTEEQSNDDAEEENYAEA